MLGGPTLQACASHAAAGGITAVDYAAGLLAVGQREGPTLLFSDGNFGAVIELPLDGNLHDGTCTLAFSLAGDVLLLGSRDGALFRLAFTGQGTQLAVVPLEQNEDPAEARHASISSIVRQHEGDIFAVATGRCIYVLDASGAIHTKIGPLPEPLLQLSWVDSTTLVGATAGAIHTWPRNGSQLGPVLRNLSAAPYLLFATSPDSRHLAVASAAREVQCWELGAVLESEATHVAEPVHLDDYEAPVVCLEWDPQSRYLATSDGSDVTIWDLSDGSTGGKAASIACCGHEQSTRVVRMAFCPEGNLLATASDSAKIVLFNVQQFRKGGVAGPVAVAALDAPDEEVTALRWLPGSRLLAGTATGKVRVYQVGPDPSMAAAVPQPLPLPMEAATAAARAVGEQGGADAGTGCDVGDGRGPGGGSSSLPDSFAQMSLAGRLPKAVRTTHPSAAPPEGAPPSAAVAPSSAAAAATLNNPRQRPGSAAAPGPGPLQKRGVGSPRQDYGGPVGPPLHQAAGGVGVGVGALPPAVAAALGLPPPQVYFTSPPRRAPAAANGLASGAPAGEGSRGNQNQNGSRRRQQQQQGQQHQHQPGQLPHSHAPVGGGAYPGAYSLDGVPAAGLALPSYGSAGEGPRTPANARGDHLGELHSGPQQQGQGGGAGGGWGGGGTGGRQHGSAAAGGGRSSRGSGSGGSLSPSTAAARTSPFALAAAAAAAAGYQPQQQPPAGMRASPALHRAGSSGGGPTRFGSSSASSGGAAAGPGSTGAHGYGGMSTSLMQHIQAVRENPPQGRGDGHHHHHQQQQRRQELAGWGAGQPGGVTSLPWMVVMPPGAASVAGATPMPMPGLSPYPSSPAQAQQMYAAQYHAAMMQRMAQGGQPVMQQVQFVQAPTGALPTSPRAMPASSQAATAMLAMQPMNPAAPLQPAATMLTHTPAGPYMIPYMQQWPGAPPMAAFPGGYMAFPAAPARAAVNPAYMAAAMQAASRAAQPQPPASPAAAAAAAAAAAPGAGQQGFPPRGGRPQRQPSLPQAAGAYVPGQQQVPPPPQGRGSSEGAYSGALPPRRTGSLQHAGSGLPPTPRGTSRASAIHPPPEEPRPAGPAAAASPHRAAGAPPAATPVPAALAAPPAQSVPEKRYQADSRAGGGHEAGRCNSAAAVEAAGFSPTAVLEARGDAGSSVAPTPGGSAGDVHSVQGSTQRSSLDLPLSPMDRTSPRLALGITGGSGSNTALGPGAAAAAGAGVAGAAGRSRSGTLNRRSSIDEGAGETGRKDDVVGALARHLSGSGSMPDSPASPTNEVVTVYVGNLPAAVDEYTLACTFMHFGPVVHVQIIRDKATMVSKGFGFVSFAHPAYATLAMQQMDQQVLYGPFGGLRIKVAPSKQGMGPGGSVPSTPQLRSMFPQQ